MLLFISVAIDIEYASWLLMMSDEILNGMLSNLGTYNFDLRKLYLVNMIQPNRNTEHRGWLIN